MDVVQLLQVIVPILTALILYQMNVNNQRSIRERAEILSLLQETRARQDKHEERLYRLEVGFEIRSDPPTHMKRPSQNPFGLPPAR